MRTVVSWNVNGVRAAQRNGLLDWLAKAKPDVLCIQETKAAPDQLDLEVLQPSGYRSEWASAAAAKRFADAYRDVVTKRNTHRQAALVLELKDSSSRVDVTLRVPATTGDKQGGVDSK